MQIKTVGDLMEILEELDSETPIFLAQQPNWPFEYTIGQIIVVNAYDESGDGSGPRVYIGEGQQTRYLPNDAAEELGWR